VSAFARRAAEALLWQLLALWTVLGLDRPIGDGDECYHAEIMRQMMRSGDYLHPRWYGVVTHSRPPLMYWLAAPFSAWIPGEVGVRFSSALASFLTLGVMYQVTWTLWQRRSVAVLAVLLLAGAPSFHVFTRTLMSEAPFVLALTVALVGTLRAQRERRALPLAAAGLGCAFAVKSLAAGVPAVALAPWLVRAQLRHGDRRTLWAGLLTLTLLALAPFALGLWVDGSEFVHDQIVFNLLERARGGYVGMGGGLFAYVKSVLFRDGPVVSAWLVIGSAGALVLGLKLRQRALQIVGSYALAELALMSLFGTRLPHYILPLYPAAALGAAGVYAEASRRFERLRAPLWAAGVCVIALVIGLVSQRYGGGADYLFERPESKILGLRARNVANPGERVYAYEWYGFAIGYYADRPVELLTAKPERFAQVNFAGGPIERAKAAALVPPPPAAAGSRILIAGHVADLSRAHWLEVGEVLAASPPYFLAYATVR
jgi:4-amino-4-deoxy-L-arabinose transferase-like glycosyltransferase